MSHPRLHPSLHPSRCLSLSQHLCLSLNRHLHLSRHLCLSLSRRPSQAPTRTLRTSSHAAYHLGTG